jgi:3',5'-cyclic AMP phosphodiesterase CpdA
MPETEVRSLILRFRDLSTLPGETLQQHRQISLEKGHVWWGWWSKLGETVPEEVFRQLNRQAARPEGLDIFLLDTGSAHLFQARCAAIQWETSLEPFTAPEEGRLTPSYYQSRRYLAWFKLSEIRPEPLPEETLRRFSYVRVDDFFGGSESRYLPFYGKRLYSIAELIPQNRTIWFIRNTRPEDPIHEISLFDARRIEPRDFPPLVRQTSSRNLLWVSDLHFSIDNHHGFPVDSTPARKSVSASLRQSLEEDLSIQNLAGCIVSGDLTWKSAAEEYQQVRSFLDELQGWSQLDRYDLLVCPGNHDLPFSADPADKAGPVDVDIASETARAAYSRFYRETFFKEPNSFLSSGRKFLLGGALPVEIVCLNSSLLEQQKGLFQGHGFLGDEQLADAATQMGWRVETDGPVAFRIAVLHHHLLPVTYREEPRKGQIYSVVLDAEALARWIVKHRVRLVLHGHMHQPFCARVARPVDLAEPSSGWHAFHVIGLGSTGVERGHLGTVGKNVFGLLRFERDHLKVGMHTIDPGDRSQLLWELDIPYQEEGN